MQSVQAAALAVGPRRPRRGRLARLALVAVLAAAGTLGVVALARSGGDPSAPSRATPVAAIAGAPLQRARCRDWRAAGPAERLGAVQTLSMMVGGPTPAGPATTLGAAQAERLFDGACAAHVARNFLLYEMYIRAAAFKSFLPTR